MLTSVDTRTRTLDVAIENFGTRGVDSTSLDTIADELGVSKQTVLYHFGSKDKLLEAAVDHAASELTELIGKRIAAGGWKAVESVVNAVFRVAVRRPALLGLLREVTRMGPPWSSRAADALQPAVDRATMFIQQEMDAGRMRPQTDSRLVLLSAYSTVMGVATEIEVLRAVGIEPTLREAVTRRRELLRFLKSALVAD